MYNVSAAERADMSREIGVVDQRVGVHGQPYGVLVRREHLRERAEIGDVAIDHLDNLLHRGRKVLPTLAD